MNTATKWTLGGTIATVGGAVALWAALGAPPLLAWHYEVAEVERRSMDRDEQLAMDLKSQSQNSNQFWFELQQMKRNQLLLSEPKTTDGLAHRLWLEQLKSAQRSLEAAERSLR